MTLRFTRVGIVCCYPTGSPYIDDQVGRRSFWFIEVVFDRKLGRAGRHVVACGLYDRVFSAMVMDAGGDVPTEIANFDFPHINFMGKSDRFVGVLFPKSPSL